MHDDHGIFDDVMDLMGIGDAVDTLQDSFLHNDDEDSVSMEQSEEFDDDVDFLDDNPEDFQDDLNLGLTAHAGSDDDLDDDFDDDDDDDFDTHDDMDSESDALMGYSMNLEGQEEVAPEWDVYDNFDPEHADMDHIIGHPEEHIDSWHLQETDSSCAVCAQEFIYEHFTGQEISEETMREIGEEIGVYDAGGTAPADVGLILESQGFHIEQSVHDSADEAQIELVHALENGEGVIVGLDSTEIWTGTNNDGWFGWNQTADHAVQVIGIDNSHEGQPMVILNDSGHPDGCGSMIPLDLFMDAWEDGGFFMTEVSEG